MRFFDGVPYASLRSEVYHAVWNMLLENRCNSGPILQIASYKAKIGLALQSLKTRLLQGHIIVVVQIVETNDLIAPLKQGLRSMVPDKAGDTRNKYLHFDTVLIDVRR